MDRAYGHLYENHNFEVIPSFWQCDVFLYVYAIDDSETMDSIVSWYDASFLTAHYHSDRVFGVLVGNKCDLEDKREVSIERGRNMLDNLDLEGDSFFEVSVKTGEGFDRLFEFLAHKLGSRFKINDRVAVHDRHGIAHSGTVCWTGTKRRIGRKVGETC